MGSISMEEEPAQHVITVHDRKDRIALMHKRISEPPRLLRQGAGRSTCCIFKIPQTLIDSNGNSYKPRIVSIGPYHRGKPHLDMIQEHKWRFLGSLLKRTQLCLEDIFKAIEPLEIKARECYSETIDSNADEFIEMMVLDGCFIIELLRKVGNLVMFDEDDPICSMSWIFPFLLRDLLQIENQIPFFVLQKLFDLTKSRGKLGAGVEGEEESESLVSLVLGFFNNSCQRPEHVIKKYKDLKGAHLLDLLRQSYIPTSHTQGTYTSQTIQSASKLRVAGIKFRTKVDDSFLAVKFSDGVIEMPKVTLDDFMTSFFINCIAYEQCSKGCTQYFTTYTTFLDCIVNTSIDVEYLSGHNIIENYIGTDEEVVQFINSLGKDVGFVADTCYLAELFKQVDEYYHNSWHVYWAGMKYTYFATPWSFISAFAALILLLLTVGQTFYTIYPYYHNPH